MSSTLADALERCTDKGVTERAPVKGVEYFAFVVHSNSAQTICLGLAIAHCRGNTFVLDLVRENISIADAATLLQRYGISQVSGARGDTAHALAHAVAGAMSLMPRQQ
jgi:hypothetical protein